MIECFFTSEEIGGGARPLLFFVLVWIALNFAASAFSFFFFLHFTRFAEQGDKQYCSGTVIILFMRPTVPPFIKKY